MITTNEDTVSLCAFDEQGEIVFTREYLDLTKSLGSGARTFASFLISHWDVELRGLLDYFGPNDAAQDKYSGIDGEPMDVREDITDVWEYKGIPFDGLSAEWYRDVLRSKLISIKLPKRLIKEYVKIAKRK